MRSTVLRAASAMAALAVGLSLGASAAPLAAQDAADGKIPITTSSDAARDLYLQGRALQEQLRATDARGYFERAVAADPNFATAYLALANTAPSAQDFFDDLERAVAAASHASEGERLLIMAADAGVRGDLAAQKEHLTKLVNAYPRSERAHNALGNYHFARQEYELAARHFQHATGINPDFAPAYNSLGYTHRFDGDYPEAEKAFKSYIALIPDEPNPYDSYAEFLMKVGRFDESIEQYRNALERDPHFVFSFVGIANNQIFKGEIEQAVETLREMSDIARTVGERRQALFWRAAAYVHDGQTERALRIVEAMYNIADEGGDGAAMSGDLNLMGTILLESGDADGAQAKYERSVEVIDAADVPAEVKEATHRNHLYNEARVALAREDVATAKTKAMAYAERVAAKQIPFEQRQVHELQGLIELQQDNYAAAAAHLEQANQQDPRIVYLTAMAHHGNGDDATARELLKKAADFNGLNFNYAYVRGKAKRMLMGTH